MDVIDLRDMETCECCEKKHITEDMRLIDDCWFCTKCVQQMLDEGELEYMIESE